MERPSHTNFKTSHPFACRLAILGLAVSLQLAVFWGLTHDLAGGIVRTIGPMVFVPERQRVEPRVPPPDPRMEKITAPRAEMPIFESRPETQSTGIRTALPQPETQQPTAAGPDHAAVGVQSTHTIPPYPMLAQRLGAEGKVTLRLTVLADGRVGKADIVASSGRGDLDEAAQQWIVAHWAYRPALDKGLPVPSQTVVSVIFSLQNGR